MTDDKGCDRDNQKKVGFELGQKAGYYNYSPQDLEFGDFTSLFCRERQRNASKCITHVQNHCTVHKSYCFVTFLLP